MAMSPRVAASLLSALACTVALAGIPGTAAAAEEVPVVGVTASADDGNLAAHTRDNDLGTRWSAQGDGVWIRYDLGTTTAVGNLAIGWHQGNVRTFTFDIETSTNGSSWSNAFSGASSGNSLQQLTFAFAQRQARYVRVVGHGNTVNDWTSITETDIYPEGGTTEPPGDCDVPADVLDLDTFKLQLPTGSDGAIDEVKQPALNSHSTDPWFVATSDCTGVRFRAAVNGAHTSGSSYARSELREMNGTENASWSTSSGTHTMTIDQAITRLPQGREHLVAGQVHGTSKHLVFFRLEGKSLYVTNQSDTHYKLVTSNYTLGTRFEAKFVTGGGQIKAYYNGTLQATMSISSSTAYFKAGAYPQGNCDNASPCSSSNYGEVVIYKISVTG